MSEHHVSVEVNASVQQVYNLFTHFNDFPKFMSFIKEVTYYDDQRSHWVAEVAGNHEWDAVNEDWLPGQQVGWRSVNGVENSGRVKFTALGDERTSVDVYISYVPPAGILGEAVDKLGFESHFDSLLRDDLARFAAMVEEAPPGALDPMQSHYLFHDQSAYARATVTNRQEEAMAHDPMMQPQALEQRDVVIQEQEEQLDQFQLDRHAEDERVAQEQGRAIEQQRTLLTHQAERDREMVQQSASEVAATVAAPEPHPVYDTLGGRNASVYRTAFGDQDGRSERFPGHTEDPMTSRLPHSGEQQEATTTQVSDTEVKSPWLNAIRGGTDEREQDSQSTERTEDSPTSPES